MSTASKTKKIIKVIRKLQENYSSFTGEKYFVKTFFYMKGVKHIQFFK